MRVSEEDAGGSRSAVPPGFQLAINQERVSAADVIPLVDVVTGQGRGRKPIRSSAARVAVLAPGVFPQEKRPAGGPGAVVLPEVVHGSESIAAPLLRQVFHSDLDLK